MRRLLKKLFCYSTEDPERSSPIESLQAKTGSRGRDSRSYGGDNAQRETFSQDGSMAKCVLVAPSQQGLLASLGLVHQGGIPVLVGQHSLATFADLAMPVAMLTFPIPGEFESPARLSGRASALSAYGAMSSPYALSSAMASTAKGGVGGSSVGMGGAPGLGGSGTYCDAGAFGGGGGVGEGGVGSGSLGAAIMADNALFKYTDVDGHFQRLRPVFINDAAKMFLRVKNIEEYQSLLQRQVMHNPTLATLMETSVRNLVSGKACHVLHHFLLGNEEHNLVRVEVNPCAYRSAEDSPAAPCLVLQYKMGYTLHELNQRLRRDYILLSHIPSIVTVFDLNQRVVHQNLASINYMGNLELEAELDDGRGTERSECLLDAARNQMWGQLTTTHLRQLMRFEPAKMDEMMDAVLQGQEWQSIIAMPLAGSVVTSGEAGAGAGGGNKVEEEGHEQRELIVQEMQQTMSSDVARGAPSSAPPRDSGNRQYKASPSYSVPWRALSSTGSLESGQPEGSTSHRSRGVVASTDEVIMSIPEGSPHTSPTAVSTATTATAQAAGSSTPLGSSRGVHKSTENICAEDSELAGGLFGIRGLSFSSGPLKGLGKDKRPSCSSDDLASKVSKSERLVSAVTPAAPQRLPPTSPLKRAMMLDSGPPASPDSPTSSFRSRLKSLSPPSARRLAGVASSSSLLQPVPMSAPTQLDGASALRRKVSGGDLPSGSNLRPARSSSVAEMALIGDDEGDDVLPVRGRGATARDGKERSSDPSAVAIGTSLRPGESVWHEVRAKMFQDPVEGRDLILVVQTDVTSKVEAEARTADLLQAEQSILENIFPRHVIQQLTDMNRKAGRASSTGEANSFAALASAARLSHGVGGSAAHLAHSDSRDSQQLVAAANEEGSKAPLAKTGSLMGLEHLSTSHDQVTIMFADIVGFTSMCQQVAPAVVMRFLNTLYSAIDELVPIYNVYKVETAGDCYIVAGGLMHKDSDGYTSVRVDVDPLNALTVFEFAKALLRAAGKVLNPVTHEPIQMRIGLHSGPVVSGVVGTKMPRFCLFGDTMNTAQRMESTSRAGAIHASEATQMLLPKERWESTNGVEVKGKGFMETAFWIPPDTDAKRRPSGIAGSTQEERQKRRSSVRPPADPGGSGGAAGGGGDDPRHCWSALLEVDRPVSASFTAGASSRADDLPLPARVRKSAQR